MHQLKSMVEGLQALMSEKMAVLEGELTIVRQMLQLKRDEIDGQQPCSCSCGN